MNKMKKSMSVRELDAKLIKSVRDIYCCKEIFLGIQKNVPTEDDYQKFERILETEKKDSEIYENTFTQKVHFGLHGLLYNKIRSSLLEYIVIRSVAVTQSTRGSIVLDDLVERMKIENLDAAEVLTGIETRLKVLKETDDYKQVKRWRDGILAHLDVFVDLRILRTKAIITVAEVLLEIYKDLHALDKISVSDPQHEDGYAYQVLQYDAEQLFAWSDRWKKSGKKKDSE